MNDHASPSSCAARIAAILGSAALSVSSLHAEVLGLDGEWTLALDREDAGVTQRWFDRTLTQTITLPGSLPALGIGDAVTVDTDWTGNIIDRSWFEDPAYAKYREPGNVKVPFWLQPETYYAGVAWYQREAEIPDAWQGKRVVLMLERPHWETRVWIDSRFVGANDSLSTPHEYDLGTELNPGKHRITIRVDNGLVIDVGVNSHSISDHTQGNWNGIVGRMELHATPPVWIADLQVYPDIDKKAVSVHGRIGNSTGTSGTGRVKLSVRVEAGNSEADIGPDALTLDVAWSPEGGTFAAELPVGENARNWDEFNPVLYRLEAELAGGGSRSTVFGLRSIAAEGRQFTVNGRRTFLRGTLDCAIYPRTGHPPVDVAGWEKIIRTAKAHGLNHIRFHSWCPPEAAFVAADRLGFYYQVECGSWANQSTTLGDGKPVDAWLYREADRILRWYGNHPSFLLMAFGNEPGGRNHQAYLAKWVAHYKARDRRRLYTGGAGWPLLNENEFHVTPNPRIQAWGAGLRSRINALPPETRLDYRDYIRTHPVPVISHEIGQWCVYPNFEEISKYTGYLKPRNFEIFRETLAANHMLGQAHDFLIASGKLQTLCYKEEIESALRTPGMGGFQLLDLHDFPGQGTALVGILDPFWEPKGYVTAAEFRRFCGETVPLARLRKRVFTTDESLDATFEVAHFGPAPISQARPYWKLIDEEGNEVIHRQFPERDIPLNNRVRLGRVRLSLTKAPAPAKYRLVAGLADTPFENDWDIWVYPTTPEVTVPRGVTLADDLDEKTLAVLRRGGKVLLLMPPKRVKGDERGRVALGFSSIFWNTAWTRRQAPHTLGVLCDPDHPVFSRFPTEFHSNWQWWYLVTQAGAMILNDLPAAVQPLVQVIDDWVTNRRLGLLLEARVLNGRLMVCSIDVRNVPGTSVVQRQFLSSLLQYMDSAEFEPSVRLESEQILGLRRELTPMERYLAQVKHVSSEERGHEATNAIDGDRNTIWHSAWSNGTSDFPHEIQVDFSEPVRLRGFVVTPRQDGSRNGWIKDFEFYTSPDGVAWGDPVAKGTFPAGPADQTVTFAATEPIRFVRLVVLSGYADYPFASIAELNVLEADR